MSGLPLLTRRGFLKTLLAAPVVAFVPGLLWVPPQQMELDVQVAMAPLIEAVEEKLSIYGYFTSEANWRDEWKRQVMIGDAASYFPHGAEVVIIPAPEYGFFGRFIYRGAGLPRLGGEEYRIAQRFKNGEPVEPQLWLA